MKQIIRWKNLTWVEIKKPEEEDIKWLREKFNLHPLVLKELLPDLDYPKVEVFDDYLFVVVFYPFFDRKDFHTIPLELDIIVSKDYIITTHSKDIVPLKAIFDKCNLYEEERARYCGEGTGYLLYTILQGILNACFPKLSHIKENIDKIEEAIYQKKYRETVNKISLVKRDIIGFQRTIESQNWVMKELPEIAKDFFGKGIVPYFHNIANLQDQVYRILLTNKKVLSALDATNEALLTTRINEIIKVLTVFSVIVFPLTLLAAIFGMNTSYLPFVGSRYDFWIIMGIMVVGTIGMLFYFKAKKWI
jgi:magnesium transporter